MSRPESGTGTTVLTGAEILWATLEGEGVSKVFGYPGGAILPVYDALRKFPIHHVLVRHEQGAAHMADGYARASGNVGVGMATSGPGATNLVTGIATAMLDSVPIVCITGQVSSKVLGSDAFQESGHHRHHAAHYQAQLPRHPCGRHRADDPPGLPDRHLRPARPCPHRHHEGRPASAPHPSTSRPLRPVPRRPHPMLRADSSSIREPSR